MKSLLLLLCLLSTCFCTNVVFTNRCGHGVPVIATFNLRAPYQECYLNSGASCTKSYNNQAGNFKDNWGGLTLAEFSFNEWGGQDFYDLSVIVGYDTAMQISTNKGGPTVTCRNPGCGDAYLFPDDNSKNHGTGTGGTFNVVFCP